MNLFFFLFAALCAIMLVIAVAEPRRIYEYPFFMAFSFAGFILPQAWGLAASKSAPEEWLNYLFLNCFLCLACCWAGYRLPPRERWLSNLRIEVNPDRFASAGIVLIAIGYFFDFLIGRMSDEARGGSTWTGVVTIYLFLANQVFTGFAMCFYCALVYRKRVYWAFAAVGASSPLVAVVFYGRREPAALLILTTALVVFFARRIAPPRFAILSVLLAGTILIPATEQYRQALRSGEVLKGLTQIDLGALLTSYENSQTVSEVRNAMYVIAAANATGIYGYGSYYWNRIVFGFVPAQIVGKDLKDALMIGDRDQDPGVLTAAAGYAIPGGSTITCVGDTFQQFWFFGALFYAAVGFFFRHIWIAVTGPDNPIVRIFYIQAMVGTMRSVSHGSAELLPAMIYSGIFLFLVTLYARDRSPSRQIRWQGQVTR